MSLYTRIKHWKYTRMHSNRADYIWNRSSVRTSSVCSWGGVCSVIRSWRGCLLTGGCLLWGVCSRGVSATRGVCLGGCQSGGFAPRGWKYLIQVSALGWCLLLGVCSQLSVSWGVSTPGGCLLSGGSAPGGVWYPSMHWGRHPTVNIYYREV